MPRVVVSGDMQMRATMDSPGWRRRRMTFTLFFHTDFCFELTYPNYTTKSVISSSIYCRTALIRRMPADDDSSLVILNCLN